MLWSRAPMPGVRSQYFSPRLASGVAHRIASGRDGPPIAFAPVVRCTPCESSARGVGHVATVRRFGAPSALAACPGPEVVSHFVGVGQVAISTADGRNGVRLFRSAGQSPRSTIDDTGVGHCAGAPPDDEDPLPPVRGPDVGRGHGADRDPVSEVAKPGNDD